MGNHPVPRPSFTITEPRCKVCQYPHRREIDMMLATGWSQASVRRYWNAIENPDDDGEFFSTNSLSRHARNHLDIRDAAITKIVAERARQEGIDVAVVEGFLLTKAGVAETIVAEGIRSLHDGHTTAEVRDVLAAVKLIKELEENRLAVAEEEMIKEIKAFTTAVKKNVPEDLWDLILADFEAELHRAPLALTPPDVTIESEEME